MVAGIRSVAGGEYPPNGIFIEVKSKGQVDLLGNAGTAETGITALHFDYGRYHFLAWSFGSWLTSTARRVKQSVPSLLECSMEPQWRRRLDDDG